MTKILALSNAMVMTEGNFPSLVEELKRKGHEVEAFPYLGGAISGGAEDAAKGSDFDLAIVTESGDEGFQFIAEYRDKFPIIAISRNKKFLTVAKALGAETIEVDGSVGRLQSEALLNKVAELTR